MKPILNLTIRRKWLDMIEHGAKREEYRDARCRQVERLYLRAWRDGLPPGAALVLRAGYRMDSPALAVEVVGLMLRGEAPHPEWGEPRRHGAHYVLKLGAVLARGDYAAVKAWMEARK